MRTAIDLFSGRAGGWALGLARAGVTTIAGCENNEDAALAYEERWGVPVIRDIRGAEPQHFPARPWLLAGSPPCQDASKINQTGKGVDGERTGLFMDAIDLASRMRPAWLALENVGAIRSRGADRIVARMGAAGYPARLLVLGSANAGKDHDRQRVFFVAPDTESRERWSARQSRQAAFSAAAQRRVFPRPEDRRQGVGHLRAETLGCHVRAYDGVSDAVAEIDRRAYGNTLDPIFPYVIARALISWEDGDISPPVTGD